MGATGPIPRLLDLTMVFSMTLQGVGHKPLRILPASITSEPSVGLMAQVLSSGDEVRKATLHDDRSS